MIPFTRREQGQNEATHSDLVGDLVVLADRFEANGYQSVAALLVGLAFGIGRDPDPYRPVGRPKRA